MACDILDLRCIFVNEIAGSLTLAIILAMIGYFIIASRSKLGFDTTLVFGSFILLLLGLSISGFSVIFAFLTIIVALMVAWIFDRIIGNR